MASVIINYCSNEKIFLDALLIECSKFSKDIVVSYGSKLYDGSLEDLEHIQEYASKYKDVRFVQYEVNLDLDLKVQIGVVNRPTAFWHNLARYTAVQSLKNKEWVFVIDCDEIPSGDDVKEWLSKTVLNKECSYKMANYWYFKYPTNQAKTFEDSVLLIHSDHLTAKNIFGDLERDYLIPASGTKLNRMTVGSNKLPMWHHYSWTRSKESLAHKIKNWAHSNDIFKNTDVDKLIEFIYHNDDVNDVIHHYQYNKVENTFNIIV